MEVPVPSASKEMGRRLQRDGKALTGSGKLRDAKAGERADVGRLQVEKEHGLNLFCNECAQTRHPLSLSYCIVKCGPYQKRESVYKSQSKVRGTKREGTKRFRAPTAASSPLS